MRNWADLSPCTDEIDISAHCTLCEDLGLSNAASGGAERTEGDVLGLGDCERVELGSGGVVMEMELANLEKQSSFSRNPFLKPSSALKKKGGFDWGSIEDKFVRNSVSTDIGLNKVGVISMVATENQGGDMMLGGAEVACTDWVQGARESAGVLSESGTGARHGLGSCGVFAGSSVATESLIQPKRMEVSVEQMAMMWRVGSSGDVAFATEGVLDSVERVRSLSSLPVSASEAAQFEKEVFGEAELVLPFVEPLENPLNRPIESVLTQLVPSIVSQGDNDIILGTFESQKIDELFERVGKNVESLVSEKESRVVQNVMHNAFECVMNSNFSPTFSQENPFRVSVEKPRVEGEKSLVDISVLESVVNMGMRPNVGVDLSVVPIELGNAKGKKVKVKSPTRKSSRVMASHEFKIDSEVRAMALKKKKNDFGATSKLGGKSKRLASLKGKDLKKEMMSKEMIEEVLEECRIELDAKGVKEVQRGMEDGLKKK